MAQIERLLKNLENWDKDERYMACSDMIVELQKNLKIDAATELRICTAILARLDDKSNDVQSKAIQCLGILLKKVQHQQVLEICDKLCTFILDVKKDDLRDIYSIGLKTLVADVPEQSGRDVAQHLVGRLLSGIAADRLEIKLECLDVLGDLLRRFGHEMSSDHQSITMVLLDQLLGANSATGAGAGGGVVAAVTVPPTKAVLKKTTASLGAAAVVLSDSLLNVLVEKLLASVAAASGETVRTLVQTIGQVSRSVGFRVGRHLDAIVPLFLKFLGDPADEALQTDRQSELRETCFQGFESFVLRCPREITPHLAALTDVGIAFMKYDPNYCGDDDDAEEDEDEGDDFSDNDYDDDGMDDEDDDTSWKVRRAAVKVLAAVVASRPELLSHFYACHAGELVSRFREREENVRLDVIECFTCLVRTTAFAANSRSSPSTFVPWSGSSLSPMATADAAAPVALLQAMLSEVMAAALKQLAGKDDKSRSAVFSLLKQLCMVLPAGGMAAFMDKMIVGVTVCLKDKNHSLKLDALVFLRLVVENNHPTQLHAHIPNVLPLVLDLVQEEWYKIIAEALRVVAVLVTAMRPLSDASEGMFDASQSLSDPAAYVESLYSAILPRLEAHDIDQEIKECAIAAMGQLVATCGDLLKAQQLPTVLSLLMEKLKNEITRMAALRSLVVIARSPLDIDLSPILASAVQELALLLRQQSRSLKQTTLETLTALVDSSSGSMDGTHFELMMQEAAPLISDSDLQLTHLSLRLTIDVVKASPGATTKVGTTVLPAALSLSCSPLLQGRALLTLLELLKELVAVDAPGASFDDLYDRLRQVITSSDLWAASADGGSGGGPASSNSIQKQAVANVGHCLAALCVQATDEKRAATIVELLGDIKSSNELRRHLALLTVGELGQHKDLTSIAGDLQGIIFQSFSSTAEETKTAAAYALGSIAVGNMPAYLPPILSALAADKNHYLLLSALKEIIVLHAAKRELTATFGSQFLEQVLPPLFEHCQSPEEGVRNMVAECLGALVTMHPESLVERLKGLCADASNTRMRWTVVSSLKYSMMGTAPQEVLIEHMEFFLALLKDDDLAVRHASLQMCNATVHHQPGLISHFLNTVVQPVLFETVTFKAERVVDLGPFKQKVDDGLPLRKVCLATINTILDTMPEQLDVASFIEPLKVGLADQQDVQVLCHQILIKILSNQLLLVKGGILSHVEGLMVPLKGLIDKTLKSISKKMKDGQSGTEIERLNDLMRSCLRSFLAFGVCESIGESTSASKTYSVLKGLVQSNERLRALVDAIQMEG